MMKQAPKKAHTDNSRIEEIEQNEVPQHEALDAKAITSENEAEEPENNWEDFREITNGDFKRLLGCG